MLSSSVADRLQQGSLLLELTVAIGGDGELRTSVVYPIMHL